MNRGTGAESTPETDAGRENRGVSPLPPPPPPGVPPPTGTTDGANRGPITSADPSEWDWDRIRELAERWFRPLIEPEGWRALGYLFVGMFSGIGFFVALAAAGGVVLGLVFVVVGIFLIAPWFALARAFTDAERAMARWMGVEIEPRAVRPGRSWRTITDPERWRLVGYVAVNAFLAPVLGTYISTFIGLPATILIFAGFRFLGGLMWTINPIQD